MNARRHRLASVALLAAVVGVAIGLAAWKYGTIMRGMAMAAAVPEPAETVTAAAAAPRMHRATVTSIGTVLALRSITLSNELAGTVSEVMLTPGDIVEAGETLVALDVSVEKAELAALEAQAELATTLFERAERLASNNAISDEEVDRARAERDIARAQVARTRAVIERKRIRAPFRARVGLADVHPGQYLSEGTELTTLQGVEDAVHVDFEVAQQVAADLQVGDLVEISASGAALEARIVAIDARVDPATRNAAVRARIESATAPSPGASVRVTIPTGPAEDVVAIPASALRRGPTGDYVFVIATDPEGATRAQQRPVESGALLGDHIVIRRGLTPGELIAASGSFKLQDGMRVTVANAAASEH
jgi:membrane fusion protein (multidrug efflux system)